MSESFMKVATSQPPKNDKYTMHVLTSKKFFNKEKLYTSLVNSVIFIFIVWLSNTDLENKS